LGPAVTIKAHTCPCCQCDAPRLTVNTSAPFYALVELVDHIAYDEGRRTIRKAAALCAPAPSCARWHSSPA